MKNEKTAMQCLILKNKLKKSCNEPWNYYNEKHWKNNSTEKQVDKQMYWTNNCNTTLTCSPENHCNEQWKNNRDELSNPETNTVLFHPLTKTLQQATIIKLIIFQHFFLFLYFDRFPWRKILTRSLKQGILKCYGW